MALSPASQEVCACASGAARVRMQTANPARIPIRRRANFISNLRGGGGGSSSVAYHKPRQKRKRRKPRIGGRCGRRVGGGCSLRGRFWVETKQIISPSRGFLQIKRVVPSSSCCAGGVPARWRGDSRDGKQPPGIVSSAPPRCVLRSGASHSLQWGGMPALRRRFRNDDGGDSFAVGLGAVAGACVDHGSGQARMPPQERRHEEVFVFAVCGRCCAFP